MAKKHSNPAGRFGARYGVSIRKKINQIEEKQRRKQYCPFCKGISKREALSIWRCKKCKKRFAAHSYFLEKGSLDERIIKEAKSFPSPKQTPDKPKKTPPKTKKEKIKPPKTKQRKNKKPKTLKPKKS